MAYAGRFGQTPIDRPLYLPRVWAEDGMRRAKTQVPEEVVIAIKPVLAREMIGEALDAGVPCAFVMADTVYGSDFRLRQMLDRLALNSVTGLVQNPQASLWIILGRANTLDAHGRTSHFARVGRRESDGLGERSNCG